LDVSEHEVRPQFAGLIGNMMVDQLTELAYLWLMEAV
jgi:hypothetical protein